ncbi:MAG: methyltransferase domain-containing protein [Streptosporangiales bacterium]|nr:methyltransferase domain-containing protein [Streptosporangiales bacterium]
MTQPASPAIERSLALLDPVPTESDLSRGYLDLLGGDAPQPTGLGQALMLTRLVPAIYERWWRPLLGQLAKGLHGPSMAEEYRMAREMLDLAGGEVVLDVACGPGNVTRELARVVGENGLVLGIDASASMLARAADNPAADNVGYIRGDAVRLPFRDAIFDAACCFAALHLFADPFRALDHMARVLAPSGRIALFTTHRHGVTLAATADALLGRAAGLAMFRPDEIVEALAERGFTDIRRQVAGLTQFVAARKED